MTLRRRALGRQVFALLTWRAPGLVPVPVGQDAPREGEGGGGGKGGGRSSGNLAGRPGAGGVGSSLRLTIPGGGRREGAGAEARLPP